MNEWIEHDRSQTMPKELTGTEIVDTQENPDLPFILTRTAGFAPWIKITRWRISEETELFPSYS